MVRKISFMLSMLKIKLFKIAPFPLYVNLVINRRCNLKCVYCFGEYYNRKEEEYSLEEIKKIIDQIYSMGTRYILIQGGEPFLQKDLGAIIEYIDKKGIIPAITTNGTLTHRIVNTPQLSRLDYICFSLDGFGEGNDKQRGVGVFDKIMASVEKIREHFPKLKIKFNSVLTKYTIDSFPEFLDFCQKKNIDIQVGYLFKEHPIAAPPEKVKKMADFIYQKKKHGAGIVASADTLKYVRDWPFEGEIWVTKEKAQRQFGKKAKECQYGHYEIVIDNNGNLYPCNALQGDPSFKPKNLKEVGIKAAFGHLQTKKCYTCNIASMIDTSQIINWNFRSIFDRIGIELKGKLQLLFD